MLQKPADHTFICNSLGKAGDTFNFCESCETPIFSFEETSDHFNRRISHSWKIGLKGAFGRSDYGTGLAPLQSDAHDEW